MPLYRSTSILIAVVGALGCSAPVVDDVADASGGMTEGVVLIERTSFADGAAQTNVSAKFMRLSTPADPELAERLVGSRLDLPAEGACRPLASGHVERPAAVDRSTLGNIELIDVGDVTLRAGAGSMPLSVRAFPDVGDLVSGMFYTSRDTTSDLPLGETFTLSGSGSGGVDRFAVEADAPTPLEDVRVGGISLADGVALDEGAPVQVSWRPVATERASALSTSDTARDLVLIDVSAANGAVVRCAFADAGKAVLPGWTLQQSTLGALPASATLAVHRVRRRGFASTGIDVGEVRFDLSVLGRATVSAAALP